MPVLSFPCVIHRLDSGPRSTSPTSQRVWIKGHDLRTLALAATKQLGATHQQCEYALVSPETCSTRSLLEIAHADGDVLVGPMAAPLPTPAMSESEQGPFTLDALINALGFTEPEPDDSVTACAADHPRQHVVIVTYSPICDRNPFPPVRQERETDTQYQQRYNTAERIRIERTSQQGMHLVRYDVPPEEWTAQDLEALMAMAYQLLPTTEPRWRESGAITQAKFVDPRDRRVTLAYCLQVGRGDYVAHLRLPLFPMLALAEWLTYRHCDINLRHPVMRLELIARGWRSIDRLTVRQAPTQASGIETPCLTAR